MKPEGFQISELIEHMRGTCMDINEACNNFGLTEGDEDLTTEDHAAIDNEIFRCEQCGWWCDCDEESEIEPGNCQDCSPDDE